MGINGYAKNTMDHHLPLLAAAGVLSIHLSHFGRAIVIGLKILDQASVSAG